MNEWHAQNETGTQPAQVDAADEYEAAAHEHGSAQEHGPAEEHPAEVPMASEGPTQESAEPQLIDRLQERLRELDMLPVSEHPARYEALHGELSDALTVLDRAARSDAASGAQRR